MKFYRVERHFVICSVVEEKVYVLTVKHAAMDLPERIGELEPRLRAVLPNQWLVTWIHQILPLIIK